MVNPKIRSSKKRFWAALLVLCMTPSISNARNPMGLGIVLGEPMGFSGLFQIDSTSVVDFGIGVSFYRATTVWGDFLWTKKGVFGDTQEFFKDLVAYMGPGAFLDNLGPGNARVGLRYAFGALWAIPKSDFKCSFDLAPALSLGPGSAFGFQAGVSIRYFL